MITFRCAVYAADTLEIGRDADNEGQGAVAVKVDGQTCVVFLSKDDLRRLATACLDIADEIEISERGRTDQ